MDARSPWIVRRSAVALATLAWVNMVWSGSLEPTPGVPASTMKPLDQVEPRVPVQSLAGSATALFVISQPGSYYLTANIVAAAAGKSGIEIAADSVTVDLMGFALIGPPTGTDDGIFVSGTRKSIAVYNGTIRNWGGDGLEAADSAVLARDLRLHDNGLNGMIVSNEAIVIGCSAESNGIHGFRLGSSSSISNCSANNNGVAGIDSGSGSSISYCTASGNGETGIDTSGTSVVTDSTADANTEDGIRVGQSSSISNCSANNNGEDGINAQLNSSISYCTALGNGDDGVFAASGATISGCTARGNAAGIRTGGRSVVTNSAATGNIGVGISVSISSSVTNCVTVGNTGDGIQVSGGAIVLGNSANQNSAGVGIRVFGRGSRIEGNTLFENLQGIDANDPGVEGNVIIKNSAMCNPAGDTLSTNATNYDVGTGNDVGPMSSAATATSPWANISVVASSMRCN